MVKAKTGKGKPPECKDIESSPSQDKKVSFAFFTRYSFAIAVLSITIITLLIYSNTFYYPFHFDDFGSIVGTKKITDLSYFFNLTGKRYAGYLSFALNYYMGGLNTFGYHLTNILIHIINGILVYVFVILTFKTPAMREWKNTVSDSFLKAAPYGIALISAIIFVSHPIQTQAVTYIVQRFASLATLFYLLTLVFYIRAKLLWVESKGNTMFPTFSLALLSLISAILAMTTKQIAFTLPFIILLYEFTFFSTGNQKPATINRKRLLYVLSFLAVLSIIPFIKINESAYWAIIKKEEISGIDYLFTQFRVIVTYLRLLILPVNQNLDYDYPIYHSFFEPGVYISFFFLSLIFLLSVYCLLRTRIPRLIPFGILWFFITLSVESSVVPLADPIFEHRLYLPSVGFIIASVLALFYGFEWMGRKWRVSNIEQMESRSKGEFVFISYLLFFIVIVIVPFSVATYKRNFVWKDEITLWSDAVAKSPNKARPHYNLGNIYLSQNKIAEAIEEYQETLRIDPEFGGPHNNLGNIYFNHNKFTEAINEYKEALRLRPEFAGAHNNLGNVYLKLNKIPEAISEYKEALRLKPTFTKRLKPTLVKFAKFAKFHYNLGNAYLIQNRIPEAINEFKEALKIKPEHANAHFNLAVIYHNQNKTIDAIEAYREVLTINPAFVEAHYNLGNAYLEKGYINDATKEFEDILKIEPDHSGAKRILDKIKNRSFMRNIP